MGNCCDGEPRGGFHTEIEFPTFSTCCVPSYRPLEQAIFAFSLASFAVCRFYSVITEYGHVYVDSYDYRRTARRRGLSSNPRLSTFRATALRTRVSSTHFAPTKWLIATLSSTCSTQSPRSEKAPPTWGSILQTAVCRTKREFARVVTAWKTAKVMSETKLQYRCCGSRAWSSCYTPALAIGHTSFQNLRRNMEVTLPTTGCHRSRCLKISVRNSLMGP